MRWRGWIAAVALPAGLACGGAQHAQREGGAETRREAPDEPAEKGVPPRGERPRVPSAPEALLAPGAIGRIQQALEDRGYLAARHTRGELDAATSSGIRKFQEDEGLAATGMPDRETLDRLDVNPNAAYGREGAEEGKR